jgi:hypothetical protein
MNHKLYPIIRRVRRPLVEPEAAVVVPPPATKPTATPTPGGGGKQRPEAKGNGIEVGEPRPEASNPGGGRP